MSNALEAVRQFLTGAGFDIRDVPGPFDFVAQNDSILVFVITVETDLDSSWNDVLTSLSGPFISKRFGPKTLEMYCVFVSRIPHTLQEIERCEQNIKVCRKVVISESDAIGGSLAFLSPLDEVMTTRQDTATEYWEELANLLNENEMSFLRKIDDQSATSETVLELVRKKS
jgi:hypothetical protein